MITTIDDVANKFFDYVIVGGGTAGLTIAARLSEDLEKSVLVLEAGGANIDDPNIQRPASYGSHFSNSDYTWTYQTIKQDSAGERQVAWQRGKGLGGSSEINFLCWTKPPARDIDDIEMLGNPGWNWKNFEKYVARAERYTKPTPDMQALYRLTDDTDHMGSKGPIQVAYPPHANEADSIVHETYLRAGLPLAPNPISGNPNGAYFAPNCYDIRTNTRSYSATGYYLANKDRANLSLLVHASAHRIATARTGNGKLTAIAVEFEYAGVMHCVNAIEEIILSAGTLQNPHILEFSGIGSPEVLRKADLPITVELPGVGENVQEHTFVGVSWELKDNVSFETLDILRDPAAAAEQVKLYAEGQGLYTSGVVSFAFATLDQVTPLADSMYHTLKAKIDRMHPSTADPGLIEQYKLMLKRFAPGSGSSGCEFIGFPGYLSQPLPPIEGKKYITVLAATNHTFSRGSIHTTSSDPNKDPAYDPRYFEESIDLEIFVEMVKFIRKLGDTAPLKDVIKQEHNPGPAYKTDEQLREWIKATFGSTWHTAGSCSMLPFEKGGVVDPTLTVYGTNNLRVVDLSIVPLHFAAHPQATVYAIAEQAADMIQGKFSK